MDDVCALCSWIYSSLPESKQLLALSATYPEALAQHVTRYMKTPTFVRLNAADPALLGIRQYYDTVPMHHLANMVFDRKTELLVQILSQVSFQQCLVFSNLQTRAEDLARELSRLGWPATHIAGKLEQQQRLEAYSELKGFVCRVLVTTDLVGRRQCSWCGAVMFV